MHVRVYFRQVNLGGQLTKKKKNNNKTFISEYKSTEFQGTIKYLTRKHIRVPEVTNKRAATTITQQKRR